MRTSDFDYHLPTENIAQTPLEPRDSSRLLVLHQNTGLLEHTIFHNLGDWLNPNDCLVINRTQVIPARLSARKPTGGQVELLLLHAVDGDAHTWEVLAGGKNIHTGIRLQVENGPACQVTGELEGARRLVTFETDVFPSLAKAGVMPLPPYIHTPLADSNRYQTVYAQQPGSAAAPTAGLHFTPGLIDSLKQKGIQFADVTLHVGLDTFQPVNEDDPLQHVIHTEWCEISAENAALINQARRNGGRIVAVGTTSVRTLESAAAGATNGEAIAPYSGRTALFILPGYTFSAVDAMITNFHLPRSTLLMLVSAFAGREQVLSTYAEAIRQEYRFYSFGDAMLIL